MNAFLIEYTKNVRKRPSLSSECALVIWFRNLKNYEPCFFCLSVIKELRGGKRDEKQEERVYSSMLLFVPFFMVRVLIVAQK